MSEPCLCLGQLTDLELTRTGKPVKPPRADSTPEPAEARPLPSRIPWAELLLRVFREDVLSCPCGGRRTVLAFIIEKKAVQAILEHLGLPTTGPPITPLRGGSDRRALLRVSCLPHTGGRKIAYQVRRRPKRRVEIPIRTSLGPEAV